MSVQRRPDEEFGMFLERLDAERLRAIAEEQEIEARALELSAERADGNASKLLNVSARAKRASASEWLNAWQEHPGSPADREDINGGVEREDS